MKVLVACEFSGIVRDAFITRRHDAWSCDLLPSERPGNHIQDDILNLLGDNLPSRSNVEYPVGHPVGSWDLMIAFPPCTHLAVSGARWFKDKQKEQKEAIDFFLSLIHAPIPRICVENPIGIMSTLYRKPDQIIQPWQFGHGETKATCLWLKNLPKLIPTKIVDGRIPRVHFEAPGPDRWKNRSRTLQGIADAMADLWGAE